MIGHDVSIPNLTVVTSGVVHEDTTVTLLARVMVDSSNTLTAAVQSDFSAISYTVYSGGVVVTASTSLTIASVIYNTLQTGTIWGVDSTGFNFKATIAASSFPTGATTYLVEVKFTLASSAVFFGVFKVITRDLQSQ